MAKFFNAVVPAQATATQDVFGTPARIGGKKTAGIFDFTSGTLLPIPEGKGERIYASGRRYGIDVGIRVPYTKELENAEKALEKVKREFKGRTGDPAGKQAIEKATKKFKAARNDALNRAIRNPTNLNVPQGFEKVSLIDRTMQGKLPQGVVSSPTAVTEAQYETLFRSGSAPVEGAKPTGPKLERVKASEAGARARGEAAKASFAGEGPVPERATSGAIEPDIFDESGNVAEKPVDKADKVGGAKRPTEKYAYENLSDANKRRVNRGAIPLDRSGREIQFSELPESTRERISGATREARAQRMTRGGTRRLGGATTSASIQGRLVAPNMRTQMVLQVLEQEGVRLPVEVRKRIDAFKAERSVILNEINADFFDEPEAWERSNSTKKVRARLNKATADLVADVDRHLLSLEGTSKREKAQIQKLRKSLAQASKSQSTTLLNGNRLGVYEVAFETETPYDPKKGGLKSPRGTTMETMKVVAQSEADALAQAQASSSARGLNATGVVRESSAPRPGTPRGAVSAAYPEPIGPTRAPVPTPPTPAAAAVEAAETGARAGAAVEGTAARAAQATGAAAAAQAASKGSALARFFGQRAGMSLLGRAGGLLFGPAGTLAMIGMMGYDLLASPRNRAIAQAQKNNATTRAFYELHDAKQAQRMERKQLSAAAATARSLTSANTTIKLSPELEAVLGTRRDEILRGRGGNPFSPSFDEVKAYSDLIS